MFFSITPIMKVLMADFRKGICKISVETPDDLWHLSHIVDPGDLISGKTQRKIKKTAESDNVKRTIFLEIAVTNVDYETVLRVSGTVSAGPEDVPIGSYHTFTLEVGTTFTITKTKWYTYHINRLKEAEKQNSQPILITVFDREEAIFAKTAPSGYTILAELKGDVEKKRQSDTPKGNFYDHIIMVLQEYDSRYNA